MAYDVFTEVVFLGNSLGAWATAVAVGLLVAAGLFLARGLLRRRFSRRAAVRGFRVDALIAELLAASRTWLLLVVGVFAGARLLLLAPAAQETLAMLLALALLLQAALWGNRAIVFFADRYRASEALDAGRRTSLAALTFVGRLVLYSILLLVAVDNLGFDVTALLAGLGVGSIAVALALQGILGDLFASLSIVFDKPFEIGDFIIVGSDLGTVENIGLRTTRVRSLSGEQLVFANTDLLESRIRNFKRMEERRVVFSVGVVYGTPADRLESVPGLIREIVEGQGATRFDRSHFKSFGSYSLDFETVYYVLGSDYNLYMDVQQAINLALYRRFAELGIEFAYPTQTVQIAAVAAAPAKA